MEIRKQYTREDIVQAIQAIREIDAEGKRVGRKALAQRKISPPQIEKLIPEGLTELKQKLGIYRKWLEQQHPESENIIIADNYLGGRIKIDAPRSQAGRRGPSSKKTKWKPVLNFKNLAYAPTI